MGTEDDGKAIGPPDAADHGGIGRGGGARLRRGAPTLLAMLALPLGFVALLQYLMNDAGMDHGAMPGMAGQITATPMATAVGAVSPAADWVPAATPTPIAGGGPTPSMAVDAAATSPPVAAGRGMPGGGTDGGAVGNPASAQMGTGDPAVAVESDPAGAASSLPGTVVGTPQLEIRSCPEPSCDVVATAPLGASVTLEQEASGVEPSDAEASDLAATGKFVSVGYQGRAGYAPDLFVTTEPAHVPYLLQGEEGCKRVALIFNVGVGEEPATGILDTLEMERVPATMFVMGWWAAQHPPILQRMVDEGYPIGSHGYDSVELTTRPDDEVADDIERATTAIEHAIGKPVTRYFTPYAAAIDERVRAVVGAAGYLPVAWTVPSADYGADATEESVYERVMSEMHDGGIVELHLDAPASAESTGRALPRLIDDLRAQGYRFVTVPEMARPCP